jgi:membrane-associated phospholipid phosphatase
VRLDATWWRGAGAGPVVAIGTIVVALVATREVGLPLRDPDHVAALYLVLVGCGVAGLVALDVAIRAAHRSGVRWPTREAMRRVREERWTLGRSLAVCLALASFYATYMAYRNLKSIVPLLLTIGLALVFSRTLQAGLFYTTAQSLNWVLGAASYFLLPSLGPIYFEPGAFAHLPASEVTRLQDILLDQRVAFLQDPASATPQSIAAFASLHISMSLTAVLTAHLLGLGRRMKTALWVWFALTTAATVYLGWHYVLDDVGGLLIAATALVLARALTGIDLRAVRSGAAREPAPGAPATAYRF